MCGLGWCCCGSWYVVGVWTGVGGVHVGCVTIFLAGGCVCGCCRCEFKWRLKMVGITVDFNECGEVDREVAKDVLLVLGE